MENAKRVHTHTLTLPLMSVGVPHAVVLHWMDLVISRHSPPGRCLLVILLIATSRSVVILHDGIRARERPCVSEITAAGNLPLKISFFLLFLVYF